MFIRLGNSCSNILYVTNIVKQSTLTVRSQSTLIEFIMSDIVHIICGVPQGTVLCPLKFCIQLLLKSMCIMYFSTSMNKHCGCPVIYLGNSICEFVKEVKYLGVIIHSSMKTTIDVARQTRKFYLQANLLLRNFRHSSDQVKCVLFQTYCTNLYCCQLWFNSTKSSLRSYLLAITVCV